MFGILLAGLAWPIFIVIVYLIEEEIRDWRFRRTMKK